MSEALVTLATTPDDALDTDAQLKTIVQLVADRVGAVQYASVTVKRDHAYVTVATSSEIAEMIDNAQYSDHAGPCLQSLEHNTPIAVPRIDQTINWPGFREAAVSMGLHASLSIPLFSGSGKTIAALNLYGRDAAAMATLTAGIRAIFDPELPLPADRDDLQQLDAGGEELLSGFAESLAFRSTIQLALGIIMNRTGATTWDAYIKLRLRAAETGVSLLTAAEAVIVRG
jgi:hypothetical protein